jgi:hypothetical protein
MNINDNLMINLKNNLFNENSIKKYSNNFILTPQKRIKLKRYIERVQNNEFKGETKGYLAFYEFLKDILDYEEGKHIRFDDLDDIGSGRVEFALRDNDGKFMVIELKGQNADLDKPQNRAKDKHSPVEQAFGYAQHSSKKSGLVQWILVSNYKEFRLYNYEKRLGEYISFNVEDLLNEDIFKTFMFSFSKESHVDLKAINDVVNENYIEKTQLANNFYKLFNETRLMIYKELNELHGMDKDNAIANSQTILDRFIFISFASSRKLLPENIPRNILLDRIKSGNIRDHEIWRDLNYLFIDVNEGNPDRNISEYNGGLFKEDLTDIKLKDIINDKNFFKDVYQKWNFKEFEDRLEKEIKPSILKRINPIYINLFIISYFDFSEENREDNKHKLDIEILGHIFENSIGDIEELKEDSKGRRKKEGIFYTPDYITDYICKNTIIPYLSSSGNVNTVDELLKEFSAGREVEKLDEKLKNIKIIDPACGSGAFLNKATDILLDIHKGIFKIKKGYKTSIPMRVGKGKGRKTENVQHMDIGVYVFDALSKRREILIDNIYGVDLNSESVEITKLSLFLKVCEKDKILPAIDNNIKCGNSLIDDPEYSDKAFNWEEEFKEIFIDGGFDIVIGNPPYVRHHQLKGYKQYLKDNYIVFMGLADLYVYFFEKGINILKEEGMFSFISSDKFLKVNYGENLRKFILKYNFRSYYNFTGKGVFNDVSVDPCITIIKKELSKDGNKLMVNGEYEIDIFKLDGTPWILENKENMSILNNITHNNIFLENIKGLKIHMGIFTGLNEVFIINEKLKNELLKKDPNSSDLIKPIISGKDIKKWKISDRNEFIILSNFSNLDDLKKYSAVYDHLNSFKNQLENRGQVKRGDHPWWRLSNNPSEVFLSEFDKSKLIYPEISTKLFSVFDANHYFTNKTAFIITCNSYNIKYLSVLMSSNVLNFFFKKRCVPLSRTSKNPLEKPRYNLSKYFIGKLPIYPANSIEQMLFIEKADEMLKLNKKLTNEIDSFKEWLQLNFTLEKFSKKLDKYYKLDLKELLAELKKKKVKLNSKDIKEIKEEFSSNKDRVIRLNTEIEKTDNEINQMVYDLYGLTNEEIKIIEDNI